MDWVDERKRQFVLLLITDLIVYLSRAITKLHSNYNLHLTLIALALLSIIKYRLMRHQTQSRIKGTSLSLSLSPRLDQKWTKAVAVAECGNKIKWNLFQKQIRFALFYELLQSNKIFSATSLISDGQWFAYWKSVNLGVHWELCINQSNVGGYLNQILSISCVDVYKSDQRQVMTSSEYIIELSACLPPSSFPFWGTFDEPCVARWRCYDWWNTYSIYLVEDELRLGKLCICSMSKIASSFVSNLLILIWIPCLPSLTIERRRRWDRWPRIKFWRHSSSSDDFKMANLLDSLQFKVSSSSRASRTFSTAIILLLLSIP